MIIYKVEIINIYFLLCKNQLWNPTLNGKLTPKDVVAKSGKKILWICKADFYSHIKNKTKELLINYKLQTK